MIEKQMESANDLQARRDAIGESIKKRQEENLLNKSSDPNPTQVLIKSIIDSEAELRSKVTSSRVCELKGIKLNDYLDDVAKEILIFEKNLSEHSAIVPRYELRKAQQAAKELRDTFQEIQAELKPKKKFGFKRLKKSAYPDSSDKKDTEIKTEVKADKPNFGFVISDKSGEEINLAESQVTNQDLLFNNLENCTVKIKGTATTLHLTNLKDCKILSGPISSSIFVEKCFNTDFVISCQQLRCHESKNLSFFLSVTSRGIIEDCNDIRFGPYNLKYDGMERHIEQSGLGLTRCHDKIDDFNWLANDKASPNFRILSEQEFKTFEM